MAHEKTEMKIERRDGDRVREIGAALADAVRYARDGDPLTNWKLERLGLSMKHLTEIITEPDVTGVGSGPLPKTSTSQPREVAWSSICSGAGTIERDVIRERIKAGL